MIKNRQQLETSQLRKDILTIVEEGLKAATVDAIAHSTLSYNGRTRVLKILDTRFNLRNFDRIVLVGFKDSAELVQLQILLATEMPLVEYVDNQSSLRVAKNDLVILAVSDQWRNYFLATLPPQEKLIASALQRQKFSKKDIDAVLNHTPTSLKHLAEVFYPATILGLNFSLDKNLSPTVREQAPSHAAAALLRDQNILELVNLKSLKLQPAPGEERYFASTHTFQLFTREKIMNGLRTKAEDLGYTLSETAHLTNNIVQAAPRYTCFYLENSRVPENFAALVAENICIVAAAPAGEILGVLADELTLKKAEHLGLEVDNFASTDFFGQLNDVLYASNNPISECAFMILLKN